MSLSTTKDAYKNQWKECLKFGKDAGFVDGLVIGTLISEFPQDTDELVSMFEDWKQSVIEMECTDDSKKIVLYAAYWNTYLKGKQKDMKPTVPLKKREVKSILKQRESTDSNDASDFSAKVDQKLSNIQPS